MENIKFFYTQFCPYCVESKNFIKDNNLNVELLDATSDKENQELLLDIGGKRQVPMLAIGNEAMYESSEIIKWLKENKDKLI